MAFRQLMKTALRGALQGPASSAAAARRPAVLASLSRAATPASLRPATALWVRSFGAQVRTPSACRSLHLWLCIGWCRGWGMVCHTDG
jgi:hypothetical protein